MKKFIFFLVVIPAIILSGTSCNKYEETYKPKNRISKIWFRSNVDLPDQVYTYDKKDLLQRIELKNNRYYNFEYDKDKNVTGITHINEFGLTEAIKLDYKDKFVNKIEYVIEGAVRKVVTFTRRDDNTIASITENYDQEFFNNLEDITTSSLYAFFMGDDRDVLKIMAGSGAKNLSLESITMLSYETENFNIVKTITTIPDLNTIITSEMTYDEGNNPYYGLPYVYADLSGYSRNNKLTEKTTTTINGHLQPVVTKNYQYDYNGNDYPRRIITRSSDNNNIPVNTYILFVKE